MRACARLLHISVTAERFVIKFGAFLHTHQLCVLRRPLVGNICTSTSATVLHPLKHIYWLPLVRRTKDVLMVFIHSPIISKSYSKQISSEQVRRKQVVLQVSSSDTGLISRTTERIQHLRNRELITS